MPALGMGRFRHVHGAFPDLAAPARCQEKLFWRKFLGLLKVPETGDKLNHHRLVPAALRPLVLLPEVVWRSATARLPDNEAVEPGWYFLKRTTAAATRSGSTSPSTRPSAPNSRRRPPSGSATPTASATGNGGTA
jgi:hypothetical protein